MQKGIKNVLYSVKWYFIPYLLVLTVCLILKLLYTRPEIYFALNKFYTPFTDWLAPYVTDLGNGWTTVALTLILVLFNYRWAFLLGSSYAITSILAQVIKWIHDTPRPHLYFQSEVSRIHFVKGVELLNHHSFPSGHTITGFSTTILLAYLIGNKFWQIPLLIVAIFVGYSRMYLSEHFFEDVMAGSVIGLFVTVFWIAYIDNKRFLHNPGWNKGLLKR